MDSSARVLAGHGKVTMLVEIDGEAPMTITQEGVVEFEHERRLDEIRSWQSAAPVRFLAGPWTMNTRVHHDPGTTMTVKIPVTWPGTSPGFSATRRLARALRRR